MNTLRKLILKKHPDYDFDRYSFQPGDCVETLDGAIAIIEYSAIDWVNAFIIKRSMKFRQKGEQRINLNDLPNLRYGEFISKDLEPSKSIFWKENTIVYVEHDNLLALLLKEVHFQGFHAFVLNCDNNYYLHTRIYLDNPYKDYCLDIRK